MRIRKSGVLFTAIGLLSLLVACAGTDADISYEAEAQSDINLEAEQENKVENENIEEATDTIVNDTTETVEDSVQENEPLSDDFEIDNNSSAATAATETAEDMTKADETVENEKQAENQILFYEYASDGSYMTEGIGDWQIDLCKAALRYIEVTQNSKPQYASIENGEGNQVAIHLYDIVLEEDGTGHTATYSWYYIDKDTWEGEDLFGNPIDLNQQ